MAEGIQRLINILVQRFLDACCEVFATRWSLVGKAPDLEAEDPDLDVYSVEAETKAQGLKKICLKTWWAGPRIQFHHSKP